MVRVFHHYFSGRKVLLFSAEAVAVALAWTAGASALSWAVGPAGGLSRWGAGPSFWGSGLLCGATFLFALYALDLYDLRIAGEDRRRGARLLRASGIASLAMAAVLLWASAPAGAILGGALAAPLAALAIRAAILPAVERPIRVLVLGAGERARLLARAADEQGDDVFRVCAMVDPRRLGQAGESTTSDGALEDIARQAEADWIVIACDEDRGSGATSALLRCRAEGLTVYDTVGFCERALRRMPLSCLRASDLAFAEELSLSRRRLLSKRAFDVAASAALLAVALPLMLVCALAITLDSPGPVFYRQERVGRRGRSFSLWKFRSMRVDAEKDGAVWARADDDRVTRVGRVLRKGRMDELPQLFNVLWGQMSFVGPRPERPVFVQLLKAQLPFYALREVVKPGITGWAQIRYPYGASVQDAKNKLEYDLYYVKNGSLFLDLAIIFHTVRHVLLGKGAR